MHLDVQQPARSPDGRDHRLLGQGVGRQRTRGSGYDERHVAVDHASRLASVTALRDRRGSTAARFVLDGARCFADHGVPGECVFTDRAFASTQAHAFREAMASLGARHRPTRPPGPR